MTGSGIASTMLLYSAGQRARKYAWMSLSSAIRASQRGFRATHVLRHSWTRGCGRSAKSRGARPEGRSPTSPAQAAQLLPRASQPPERARQRAPTPEVARRVASQKNELGLAGHWPSCLAAVPSSIYWQQSGRDISATIRLANVEMPLPAQLFSP